MKLDNLNSINEFEIVKIKKTKARHTDSAVLAIQYITPLQQTKVKEFA